MTQYLRSRKSWIGAICGGIWISLWIIPIAAAAPTTPANKPSIFNEPPYNRRRDSITKPLSQPITPPLPEDQPASATVVPVDGKVNIKLTNHTNAKISYQIVGHTDQRTLLGRENVTLQALPIPVAVTFRREDKGLLQVHPQISSQPGLLEIAFDESTDFKTDRVAMRIEKTGDVFLK
ncbi:hypothetical protein [Chroococcidiopsis sp.]|uniref:hypothetical protein n=1 Tax=Chroococcidiopsis sp. TaxID=3088168 RepID=UPI003F3F8739